MVKQSYKICLLLLFVITLFMMVRGSQANSPSVLLPNLPATPYEYASVPLPPYFNQPGIGGADTMPVTNTITNAGATLGRVLFYDKLLSVNNTVSCSSCHQQAAGFSDHATLSVGFAGGLTGRHSMSLVNARYYQNGRFFWDERAATLEAQTLQPIQDAVEMGMTLSALEAKLAATSYYPDLFNDAFGTPDITSERISRSLAQFIRSIVSYQSKFDAGIPINFSNFTAQENQGRNIFMGPQGGCGACHGTEIQIANAPHNNGLEAVATDLGVSNGRFKVPSLRNIALSSPYMHDGRFTTLAQVVEHYNSGVQNSPDLAPQLRQPNGQPRRLNLTQADKDALIAFMNTLTDDSITTDVRFSDPFVESSVPTAVGLRTVSTLPNSATSILFLLLISSIVGWLLIRFWPNRL